ERERERETKFKPDYQQRFILLNSKYSPALAVQNKSAKTKEVKTTATTSMMIIKPNRFISHQVITCLTSFSTHSTEF
ncbi:hypothetical protein, partial [Sodalis-like endosymbiont of Proechinophthirus fluctus]|uniref:hypothetical protein n=1 Tax=Sodalis-like endosymbiont of Proechinophthirus fluctus TaxID=1462730 RepID=UPI00195C4FCE